MSNIKSSPGKNCQWMLNTLTGEEGMHRVSRIAMQMTYWENAFKMK